VNPAATARHLAHRARATLIATVRLYEPGEEVFNDDTGRFESGPPVVHYEGPGSVRPAASDARVVEVGGAPVTLSTYDVTLPAGTGAEIGWQVAVVVSDDPDLSSRVLYIIDVRYDVYGLPRRLVCRDQTE
jgi:hypothetical protein